MDEWRRRRKKDSGGANSSWRRTRPPAGKSPVVQLHCLENSHEWRLIRDRLDCHEDHEVEFDSDVDWRKEASDDAETIRYGMTATSPEVYLVPMLADRMVVVRPEIPFNILGGQKVTIFVRTPIWVSVETGKDKIKLSEAPVERMSDTWFGPSTVEGQLCYAAKTHGVMDISEIVKVRHRAITVINIENEGKEVMYVERLNVPVKNLAIYARQCWLFLVRIRCGLPLTRKSLLLILKLSVSRKLPASWNR